MPDRTRQSVLFEDTFTKGVGQADPVIQRREDSSDQGGVEVFESTAGDLKLDLTSATGVKQLAVLQKDIQAGGQGLLEQVRLKITTSGNEGDRNWLLARIFAPIFFETADSA